MYGEMKQQYALTLHFEVFQVLCTLYNCPILTVVQCALATATQQYYTKYSTHFILLQRFTLHLLVLYGHGTQVKCQTAIYS